MQPSAVINFQETRDFGGKMNATYTFLRRHFKGLAKSLLFFAAPFVLLGSAFYHEVIVRMINLSRTSGIYGGPFGLDDYFSSANFYVQVLAAFIFLLIGGVFTVSTTYAYLLVYEEKHGSPIELGDVWRKTRKLFWSNLGTMFLYYIGLMLSAGILIIPVVILISITTFISPVLNIICLLAYYVVLIALCVYFSLLFFIRNKERIGFFSALSRLFALTKQKFWSTVVIGSVNIYIQLVFSVLFMLPWYIYIIMQSLHNVSAEPFSKTSALNEAISTALLMLYALASVLLSALPLIAMAIQYFHLVEQREARGLMHRIESFGHTKDLLRDHEDF